MRSTGTTCTRRGFRGLAAAAAAAPALAACGAGSASSGVGGTIKFWDMPWGLPAYNDAAKKVVQAYKPSSGPDRLRRRRHRRTQTAAESSPRTGSST